MLAVYMWLGDPHNYLLSRFLDPMTSSASNRGEQPAQPVIGRIPTQQVIGSWGPLIRLQPLPFVGLLLAFVRSNSFVSPCSFFVWDLSFVQVLPCSFDSSHSFEILSLSLDSCWLSFEVFFRFSLLSFRLRRLFRSSGFRSKSSFVSLCSFFVWELSFVQVLSCSFGSSHSFETSPCRWTPAGFRSKSSFVSRCSFSFETSLSFKSCLVRSTPLIRLQPLSFVGLLMAFVWSPSFVSLCSFFVSGLSFVQVLSCSFDSSHSFEIFSLSLDSCWLSFEVLLSFLSALFRFRPLFRSSPILFVRLLSFVWKPLSFVGLLLTFVGSLSFVSLCSFCSFQASLSFQSFLVRSNPLIGLQPLPFVGLLLAFVRSSSFVSLCSFFVWELSFVQVLSCSFDSSHSFEILALSLDSSRLSFEVLRSSLYALLSFQASLSFKPWFGLRRVGAYALMDWSGALSA